MAPVGPEPLDCHKHGYRMAAAAQIVGGKPRPQAQCAFGAGNGGDGLKQGAVREQAWGIRGRQWEKKKVSQ